MATSKIFVLPHLHTVLVGRGSSWTMNMLFWKLMYSRAQDIDGAAEVCGPLLGKFVSYWLGAWRGPAIPTELQKCEVALVGYSQADQMVKMSVYDTSLSRRGKTLEPGCCICAPDGNDPDILWRAEVMVAVDATSDDACELAQMQYQMIKRDHPDVLKLGGFGGHLTVAEIDCDEIRVRLVRDALPTPGQ